MFRIADKYVKKVSQNLDGIIGVVALKRSRAPVIVLI